MGSAVGVPLPDTVAIGVSSAHACLTEDVLERDATAVKGEMKGK